MARLDWPFAASVLIVMRSSRSVIATPVSAIPARAGEATRPTRTCVNLDVALRANYAVALHEVENSPERSRGTRSSILPTRVTRPRS